jgi:hypothetical protein
MIAVWIVINTVLIQHVLSHRALIPTPT